MVASQQKKKANQEKSHFFTSLTHFKLSNHEEIMEIRKVILYIANLKLKIKALQQEYEDFNIYKRDPQEVKVEKNGEMFKVKIKSGKGENNKLVNVLEAFEEMELSVAQARVSCRDSFAMEAIVVPQNQNKLCSADDMTKTLVKALVKLREEV